MTIYNMYDYSRVQTSSSDGPVAQNSWNSADNPSCVKTEHMPCNDIVTESISLRRSSTLPLSITHNSIGRTYSRSTSNRYIKTLQQHQQQQKRKNKKKTKSHLATKPFLYACLSSNYILLSLIRAVAFPHWSNFISLNSSEIILMSCSIVFSVISTVSIRIRAAGFKLFLGTVVSLTCNLLVLCLTVSTLTSFYFRNNDFFPAAVSFNATTSETPLSDNLFVPGGFGPCCAAAICSFFCSLLFISDIIWFRHVSDECTVEQKKYEFANLIFVLYLMCGAAVFSSLEGWSFDISSMFCIVTLLTIGYGDYAPLTNGGRIFMIVYTILGLLVAGFYVLSTEDVIMQDTDTILPMVI